MLLFAVILILREVLTANDVTLQSIFGALSAYLVIGLMFAAGYATMSAFGGAPFFANGQPASTATFQYFSFTRSPRSATATSPPRPPAAGRWP